MRAREPVAAGMVDRDGIHIAYEDFGGPGPAIVFAPIDPIVTTLAWKAQVPYLARYGRVVTIDPRGNGLSDRPLEPTAYADVEFVGDIIAVMDRLGIEQAPLIGICTSVWWSTLTAALHPERVSAIVAVAAAAPFLTSRNPLRCYDFHSVPDSEEGWAKETAHYWRKDFRGYLEFFAGQLLPEPHSTKQQEDFVGWGLQSPVEAQVACWDSPWSSDSAEETRSWLARVRCPTLAIHGDEDRCQPPERSRVFAELTNGELVTVAGAGHLPMAREPVLVNHAIRDFLQRQGLIDDVAPEETHAVEVYAGERAPAPKTRPRRTFSTPWNQPRRALYLSSPIGLGHARRDLAVVRALRQQVPGIEVDWLAQAPVTTFLEANGERVHPASRWLANESAHFESVCGEHDLNAFAAIRDMDEILVNNFMVFSDLVEREQYDLWTGDEAWEVDHFLHENPELKRAAYAWLTDFVGWVPMPHADPAAAEREAQLTADYNAEMLDHVARLPRIRDHALFVGNPDDVVDTTFGPGLPRVRDWVAEHYDFTGYVTGDDTSPVEGDADAVRRDLGLGPDDPLCVVAVGGSGVGGSLLRRAIEAHRVAARRLDGLRTVVVSGPRIDPASLPQTPGVTTLGFVPDLPRLLAAADVALVQGGLTTTMELTAAQRPFVYVPLRNHFEQNVHVRQRLANYGAGRCVLWDDADPERLADALLEELGRDVAYRPVETDGAARVAALLAELV